MYLSNRDIKWAIECADLIVTPPPSDGYDETSIDLHLGPAKEALIWDLERFKKDQKIHGSGPDLKIGSFNYADFSGKYLIPPPNEDREKASQLVFCRGKQVVIKPNGFLLWATQETVGTPKENPGLICFVNAKSTKARTGIIVHFTAPTIHAGWSGRITLEIANYGPFHLILEEGDAIAQLTVAQISSSPDLRLKEKESQTAGQIDPTGRSKQNLPTQ